MVFQLICSISVVDGWRVCLNTVLSTVSPSEHNSNLTFLEQVTIKAKEDKEIFDKKFVAFEKKNCLQKCIRPPFYLFIFVRQFFLLQTFHKQICKKGYSSPTTIKRGGVETGSMYVQYVQGI